MAGSTPGTSPLWLKAKSWFWTVFSLAGFAMILYGAYSAFTKYLEYSSGVFINSDLMVQVVAPDILIVFIGAGVVLFATR